MSAIGFRWANNRCEILLRNSWGTYSYEENIKRENKMNQKFVKPDFITYDKNNTSDFWIAAEKLFELSYDLGYFGSE